MGIVFELVVVFIGLEFQENAITFDFHFKLIVSFDFNFSIEFDSECYFD
jgi:hypothetical protein